MCLGDFHNNIGYLKIKKFHAHTVSNNGSFVAVTVQIVCSLSYSIPGARILVCSSSAIGSMIDRDSQENRVDCKILQDFSNAMNSLCQTLQFSFQLVTQLHSELCSTLHESFQSWHEGANLDEVSSSDDGGVDL